MKILASIRREERSVEKQLGKLQERLSQLRAAAKALGSPVSRKVKKRSAAARAKMSRAAKKRWAKIKAEAKQ